MEQYYGGSVANVTGSVMFDQPVDVETLQAALNTVVEQHDALRIRLDVQDGAPMQYISAYTPETFEVVRFVAQEEFDIWASNFARTPFDLQGDLYNFTIVTVGQLVGFVCHLHHLTCDAWTVHLLVNAVSKILNGEATDAHSYLEYIATEREYETSTRREKDKAYFLSRFERSSEPVYISGKQAGSPDAAHLSLTIGKSCAAKIQAFCETNSLSPYSLFMTALATYMYRVKGEQELYIGTAILNRSGRKEKATAGMFVNTVPVLFHIDETQSTLQNAQSNAESISGVFRHQKYQYGDLLKDIRDQYGFTDRLYDVVLSYQNAALDDGATAQFHFCGQQNDSLIIHINDRHQEGAFHLDYTYQTELFSARDIERLHGHWLNLIIDMTENPGKMPHELNLLSGDEYRQVIHDFNDTAIDYPKDKCIHQLFEEQAARTPDATALIACDETLTFAELNSRANQVANVLIDKGVVADDVIALVLPRRSYYIAAMLGILKSGGAYLPLDVNYPGDRISFLLNDSTAKLVITTPEFSGKVKFDGEILLIADLLTCNNSINPNVSISKDNLYCALHTSGSTGMPKVAGLTHGNIGNYLIAVKQTFEGVETSLSTTTVSFDIFMQETLLALICGIKVVFFNENELSNPNDFEARIEQYENCYLFQTPTRLESYIKSSPTKMFLLHIRTFIVGGEVFPLSLFELIHRYNNNNNNTFNVYGPSENTPFSSITQLSQWSLINAYGPLETTVYASYTKLKLPDITIGKPISNTQIYILDKWQNPLPIGAIGELCISGDGVGRGYLNRPELTAEKFVPNPFIKGKRMYKTGDLARWREDGNIEYIGRMDNQVKIRGLRIELGEIETAMTKYAGIKQAAVVDRKDENGRQYICAYYISDKDI
jgi:non-ribosomal peptide synthetase component F